VKKILDKIVTGFFIIILGMSLYYSVKYYAKPNQYKIIIYNIFGEQIETNEIRTNFRTHQIARNFISEYQKINPYYNFSVSEDISEIKTSSSFRIFKKNSKVMDSHMCIEFNFISGYKPTMCT
jgi:tRNA 2-selenouridine synthase SelU